MNNYACTNSSSLAQNCAEQSQAKSSGAALSSFPTHHASIVQQQQDAASALKDFSDDEILTWLKLVRSTCHIEPIPQQRPGERHLSPPQVLALSILKNCPNDRLLGWLQLARLHCYTPNSHASQRSFDSGSGLGTVPPILEAQPIWSADQVTLGTDATATDSSKSDPNHWGQSAIDPFPVHNLSRSSNSTRAHNADNHYWCTTCEEPNSYKDSGSWKKHEKEHETIFICRLDDAAQNSRAGQSHASKSFTCKRRDIMVNHLNKSHRISDAHRGRDFADQWRYTVKKQAWSCGFCISLFLTFKDRLKHVDIEHFRRHQSIHEWDLNKVILGLLQQPKMEEAWKTRIASLHPWMHPESLAWDKVTANDLRVALEKGPSDDRDANALADAAYFASKRNEGPWPPSDTKHANRQLDAIAQASLLSSLGPYQTISALASSSESYHRPNPAITDSTPHLISGDPSFLEAPTNAFALGNTSEPSIPSLDDEGRVNHNEPLFNAFQSWTPASGPVSFFNGYEPSESYPGRGVQFSTPSWYGQ